APGRRLPRRPRLFAGPVDQRPHLLCRQHQRAVCPRHADRPGPLAKPGLRAAYLHQPHRGQRPAILQPQLQQHALLSLPGEIKNADPDRPKWPTNYHGAGWGGWLGCGARIGGGIINEGARTGASAAGGGLLWTESRMTSSFCAALLSLVSKRATQALKRTW